MKLTLIYLVGAFLVGIPAAYAQTETAPSVPKPVTPKADIPIVDVSAEDLAQRIRFCAVVAEIKSRLACYDELSSSLHMNKENSDTSSPSTNTSIARFAWTRSGDDNPNGTDGMVAAIESEDATFENKPMSTKKPAVVLAVRCQNRALQVYLLTDQMFNSKSIPVYLKIDSNPPLTVAWDTSVSGKSIGLWSGTIAKTTAQALLGAARTVVHIPSAQGTIIAGFDSLNTEKALVPVVQTCK